MDSINSSNNRSKKLFSFSAILFVLALIAVAAMSGPASASPVLPTGSGSYAPLPPPTIPPTVGPNTPTATIGSPTAVPPTRTAGSPVPTTPPGTPTVPGPQPTGQPTVESCPMSFSDVLPGAWFYDYIHWLYCADVIQGYPDGTFRPGNQTTRGQIVKIVTGAFQMPTHTEGGPHFTDVPTDQTFYSYVETAYHFGIVTGYPCGGVGEPCDAQNRPYFRPDTFVSRGQLTKIIVLTAQLFDRVGWALINPPVPTFNDVQYGSTFYSYVETAVAHTVLEGYPCGDPNEPCPGRYFRPNGNASRAQLAKMVFIAVLP